MGSYSTSKGRVGSKGTQWKGSRNEEGPRREGRSSLWRVRTDNDVVYVEGGKWSERREREEGQIGYEKEG